MTTYQSSSSTPPQATDTTTSAYYTYVHYDVRETTADGVPIYTYAVDRYTKQEWTDRQLSQLELTIALQSVDTEYRLLMVENQL